MRAGAGLAAGALVMASSGVASSVGCANVVEVSTDGGGASATTSSGTTAPISCDTFVVRDPVVLPPGGSTRGIQLGARPDSPADALVTFIQAGIESAGPLMAGRLVDPFNTWPPKLEGLAQIDVATFYLLGPGPDGPSLVVDDARFYRRVFPSPHVIPLPPSEHVRFASSIGERFLLGRSTFMGEVQRYALTTLEGNAQLDDVVPAPCVTGAGFGAGAPVRAVDGSRAFLAALALTDPPVDDCVGPGEARTIAIERYAVPSNPSEGNTHTEGVRIPMNDGVFDFALAQMPFGAWVVYNYSGVVGQPRPLLGVPLGPDGLALGPPVPVTRPTKEGYPFQFGLGSIGDDLVVAWTNAAPLSQEILVQLVHPDGSFGAAASFVSPKVGNLGKPHLSTAPDGRGLLVAWDSDLGSKGDETTWATVARLDCMSLK